MDFKKLHSVCPTENHLFTVGHSWDFNPRADDGFELLLCLLGLWNTSMEYPFSSNLHTNIQFSGGKNIYIPMWTFNKPPQAPLTTNGRVRLYPGNVSKGTCVRFPWGLISSSQGGAAAAAREQRASRTRPKRSDMMSSPGRSTQRERMAPLFSQSCRTAGGEGGRHKYGRWGAFGGQVTGGRTILSACDCVIVGAAQ